ncbi:Reverse transcriptase domain-containing protein, partial [Aphis craccivora]
MDYGAGLGFVWATINNSIVYSCYCSPNCTIAEFNTFLNGLEASIRLQASSQVNLIVAGDFNAHSACWGSATDETQETLTPTYARANAASVIDVTMARPLPGNHPLVTDWMVLEDVHSASNHAYISFKVVTTRPRLRSDCTSRAPAPSWSVRKINPVVVNLYWDLAGAPPTLPANAPADSHAVSHSEILSRSCDAAMPRRADRQCCPQEVSASRLTIVVYICMFCALSNREITKFQGYLVRTNFFALP